MIDAKYIATTPDETARFDFTRNNDKTAKRINLAAELLWNRGYGNHGTPEAPIIFSDLTKANKIDLVGAYLDNIINNLAKQQLDEVHKQEAITASETEFEQDY